MSFSRCYEWSTEHWFEVEEGVERDVPCDVCVTVTGAELMGDPEEWDFEVQMATSASGYIIDLSRGEELQWQDEAMKKLHAERDEIVAARLAGNMIVSHAQLIVLPGGQK